MLDRCSQLRCKSLLSTWWGVWLGIGLAAALAAGCGGEASGEKAAAPGYTQRTASEGGTGKVYMGREIGSVMGHRGVDWMERPEREASELPDRVVRAMELMPSDVVADIGAGTGFFTFRISPEVPHGRVFAVDILPEMLDVIRDRIEMHGAENVVPVLGSTTDPNLPAASVNVALMVDAYHEFSHPYEMMTNIVEALIPGGRVVLVEYREEDPTLAVGPLHRMSEAQARKEMAAVGLSWRETRDILPQQHFMVFEKPVRTDR